MMPKNNSSKYAKEAALWAMANQNPEFQEFYDRCQQEMTVTDDLPDGFIDNVMSVVEEDPTIGPTARRYVENAQNVASFSGAAIAVVSVALAALFLLGSHIKIHKTPDGKIEVLFEHKAMDNDTFKSVAETFKNILTGK